MLSFRNLPKRGQVDKTANFEAKRNYAAPGNSFKLISLFGEISV